MWHYVENGQQVGPVTAEQLAQLFAAGKINGDTLVWQPGQKDWLPYRGVAAGAPPSPGISPDAAPAEAVCAECGKLFPAEDLISLNRTRVCAQCKPVFLQRMAEGASTPGGQGLWRQGKKLFTVSETPFPDRCVKCNAPANGFRLKRVLYWQHPAYYLLLLCNLLVLIIVVMIVRKKAVLHIGLCEAHRKQRQTAIIACTLGMIGGFLMIIFGAAGSYGWLALIGVVVFFTGVIWGVAKGRTIAATKIDKENVWVSGVGKAFLDELPERPG